MDWIQPWIGIGQNCQETSRIGLDRIAWLRSPVLGFIITSKNTNCQSQTHSAWSESSSVRAKSAGHRTGEKLGQGHLRRFDNEDRSVIWGNRGVLGARCSSRGVTMAAVAHRARNSSER